MYFCGKNKLLEQNKDKLKMFTNINNKNIIDNTTIHAQGNVTVGDVVNLNEAYQYQTLKSEIEEISNCIQVIKNKAKLYSSDADFKHYLYLFEQRKSEKEREQSKLLEEIEKLVQDIRDLPISDKKSKLLKKLRQGKVKEAEFLLSYYKEDENDTFATHIEEAMILEAQQYYNKAQSLQYSISERIEFYNQSINKQKHHLNVSHFAIFLQAQSMFDDAIVQYKDLIEIYKNITILHDSEYLFSLAGTLNNIGVCYKNKGNFEEAVNYYRESLDLMQGLEVKSIQMFNPIFPLNNLGVICHLKGNLSEARSYYNEALCYNPVESILSSSVKRCLLIVQKNVEKLKNS